jgi:hypothetical protein
LAILLSPTKHTKWIIGTTTALAFDPDQSNTLLTDYTAFDTA